MPLKPVTNDLQIRRGNLPHWQSGGSTYHVIFRCAIGNLADEARRLVKSCTLFDHGRRYDLYLPVVMPDYVHMIIEPLRNAQGTWHDLAEIMRAIKGISARPINQLLNRSGIVWQAEYYDRLIRDHRELDETMTYVWNNPEEAGLTNRSETYEFMICPPRCSIM